MSGARLAIAGDDQAMPQRAILVGHGRGTQSLGVQLDRRDLGDDGFILKTIGSRLIVAGPGARGTMYGCTTLLEKLGVRWLTPTVAHMPHLQTIALPELNETDLPAFENRDISFTEAENRDWAARLRLDGQSAPLDASTGGKIVYGRFVHTFDELIPRGLFDTHPEYFPLIKGKRTGGYVQRCLSNPDVLRIAIAGVREWITRRPDALIYSVSQNDTINFCECDKCRAIADRYGGQSGLYIWFVNQVADAIGRDHPDKLIDTLAYQFTEAPPHGIAPRGNVRVRLCPIDCCSAHPYETCATPQDRAFLEHLRGWGRITHSLYIWHYGTDFSNYLLPFPDFGEFPADIRLYQRSGVKGIFIEGDYAPGGGGSDAELRTYVAAHLMWDPALNADALVNDWMKGVYANAWEPMRQWFDLLHEKARDSNHHFFIWADASADYLGGDVLPRGTALLEDAAQRAAGDPVASDYVAKSRLWLDYARLLRPGASAAELDHFLARLHLRGIRNARESQTVDQWAREYRSRQVR